MAKAGRTLAAAAIAMTAVARVGAGCISVEVDTRSEVLQLERFATTPDRYPGNDEHVRSAQPDVVTMIREGLSRSATFGRLVATLNGSDVVVYLESARKMPTGLDGYLAHSVLAVGNRRYLRIMVDAGLEHDRFIEIVAHELQHAVEIAAAPDVNSDAAIRHLFQRLDSGRCLIGCTETDAAQEIQKTVWRELRARPRVRSNKG